MIRFKYSLTLAIEEKSPFWFMWFFAISLCYLSSLVTPFSSWLYVLCNVIAFILGWFLGMFLCMLLCDWMRERTIWSGDWERHFEGKPD
jgi:uncharacterized membrane protein YczE